MDQYCIVLCGLQAGASEDAAAWSPVATALKLDQAEFARRVLAAMPLIVRRNLDWTTAERIAQLLQAIHVDARALPDDAQLVYIGRAEATCGPLPQSAMGDFIEPGDAYRLRGSTAWLAWSAPSDEEPAPTAMPSTDTDEPGEIASSTAAAEWPIDDVPPLPASNGVHGEAGNTPPDEPAEEDDEPHRVLPPPLPQPVSTPDQATAAAPFAGLETSSVVGSDESIADDELSNPPDETPMPADADADAPNTAEAAGDTRPARSHSRRLIVLLVLAGLAYWAWSRWSTDIQTDKAPGAAATSQPAKAASAGKPAAPAQAASTADAKPAVAASVTAAPSTPALATSAAIPSASTSAAPAKASSTASAPALSAPDAPATATSAAGSTTTH